MRKARKLQIRPKITYWKKSLLRKLADTQGAVSIFMIVVLAGVFLFTAVFIDYSRIAAMEVQSERLAHAAVRSAMSAFDTDLQQQYGLFAAGESDPTQLLDTALNENFNYTESTDSFKLIPMKADTTSIQLSRPLGSYDVFNHQIQEEMKYKAPIDFTIEIVDKFKGMSGVLKEASQTVNVLEDVREPYDKREKEIDKLIALQKKTAGEVKELTTKIMNPVKSSIANKNVGSITSVADIAAQFNNYTALIAEDKKRKKKDKSPINTAKISAYKSKSKTFLSNLSRDYKDLINTHEDTYTEANKIMVEIKKYNQEIARIIEEAKTRTQNEAYERVRNTNIPGGSNAGDAESEAKLAELRKNLEQLVLSDDLLGKMESSIKTQKDDYTTAQYSISNLITEATAQLTKTTGDANSLKSSTIRTAKLLQKYIDNYTGTAPNGIMGVIEHDLKAARAGTETKAASEAKAKEELKKAKKMLAQIVGAAAAARLLAKEFDEVDGYYKESIAFNGADGGATSDATMDSDPYKESKNAMGAMDVVFGGLSDALLAGRNEFFQNEYAIQYFNTFDIIQLQGLLDTLSEGSITDALEEAGVRNQQIEYIIYGINDPSANIAAAYSEIFGMRLAIRTAEGLVKNANLGHPLAVLAAGVAYGVEMAIKDMIELLNTGKTKLSAYFPIEFEYRDYMRLFLLQPSNEKKMSRMLALIRFLTDINPAERNTYASAHIRTAMPIWFLPGVIKMVNSTSVNSSIEQGVYYADKQADYSY
ncbi:TadE/TadG family type IV pilus assembly protein [Paenibacillus nicotianae]|uniref:TadE/TadG family type IV pilus assembly protein n=1 Tax=Paenibacillus nicotianae TaxID=1526551 RepID=A0ABW4UWZ4_9BACL